MAVTGSVSVIIPCYNYGSFVATAVESALSQTHPPIEVVVVDDGSTDDTRESLQAFGSRIQCIRQENQGVSAARNAGIRQSRGEWLAFLDADDYWHPQKLEAQFRSIESLGRIDFFGSPVPRVEMPAVLPPVSPARRLGVRDFLTGTPLGLSSAVVRRSCVLDVGGFDRDYREAADRDLWLRLVARYPVAAVESPCWHYRVHAAQMNRDDRSRMCAELRAIALEFFVQHPQHRELERLAWAFVHFDAAIAHRESGRRAKALSHLLQSLAWHASGPGLGSGKVPRLKLLARLVAGERLFHGLNRLQKRLRDW